MAKSFHYNIRRIHRYFGLILGIQFLFWTIGGIYFSWSDMDEIHGDLNRNPAPLISGKLDFISPAIILQKLKSRQQVDSVYDMRLIEISGKPYYQIHFMSVSGAIRNHDEHSGKAKYKIQLADAIRGDLRSPLNRSEAIAIARAGFKERAAVRDVKLLIETSSHHEYRENPLPAYAVSFKHPANATVFVSTELGTIQKIRNDKWRIFDFLWMMHTMDYNGRDNFGNILLRTFSIFGLLTILSGFTLYLMSSRTLKRIKKY